MRAMLRLALFCAALSVLGLGCGKRESPSGDAATTTQAKPAPAAQTTTTVEGRGDVGAMFPAYTAEGLDGSTFDLASRRGKVVLINVWATWCGPCVFEIPELQKAYEKYASQGFEIIGVSVDDTGTAGVKKFIADQPRMTYPVVIDAKGRVTEILDTTVLPTSVILDRTGRIIWKKYGAFTPNDPELEQQIAAALARKS